MANINNASFHLVKNVHHGSFGIRARTQHIALGLVCGSVIMSAINNNLPHKNIISKYSYTRHT